jgi:predicted ATPase
MVYVFGRFELDAERYELSKAGVRLTIQRKAFDLLLFLVERRDVMSTKEQIMHAVWPGIVVSEAALTQAMMTLRRALGDDGGAARFIETARGRGYRFIAHVKTVRTKADAATDLLGRDPELQELDRVIEDVRARRPVVVTIGGEAGTGKSRLVEEIARRAPELLVATACAPPGAGAPPLWPWVQIARQVASAIGGAAVVAPDDDSSPRARFAFFEQLLALLDANAGRRVCVVLEDLHRADAASCELLRLLASEIPKRRLALVVTLRTKTTLSPECGAALSALTRLACVRTMELDVFPEDVFEQWVARVIGAAPSPDLLARLAAKTGRNPLLLSQLAHILRAEARLDGHGPSTSVLLGPAPLRGAIAEHTAGLPEETRAVLGAASVIGRTFTVAGLAIALDRPHAWLLERLEPAVRESVATPVASEPGSYRFSHALVRDALYQNLSAADRVHLHSAVGRALLVLFGSAALAERAAEVADHFVRAAGGGDVARAVDLSLAAATYARAKGDRAAAVRHCEAARRVLGLARADDAREARVLAMLAMTLIEADDAGAARAVFAQASRAARRAGTEDALMALLSSDLRREPPDWMQMEIAH